MYALHYIEEYLFKGYNDLPEMEYQNTRIRNIVIYPVKSAAGIELQGATLTPSGLTTGYYSDHQYMIVCNNPDFIRSNAEKNEGVYNFVTQRDKRNRHDNNQRLSALALIKPELYGDTLRLTWRYGDPIDLPPDFNYGEIQVAVWDHKGYAVDQGNEIAEWLSDHLNLGVRLVKAAGPFDRMSRQTYIPNDNPLRFQDGYPIHWFSLESADELNRKSIVYVPWQSFRPQILVEGVPAQYEHQVHEGTIAGIPFQNAKPCDRCPVTLVDQETGKVRSVGEPLRTLATYKKWRNKDGAQKVIFGENMLPREEGIITVGDELVAVSYRDPALVYGGKV